MSGILLLAGKKNKTQEKMSRSKPILKSILQVDG